MSEHELFSSTIPYGHTVFIYFYFYREKQRVTSNLTVDVFIRKLSYTTRTKTLKGTDFETGVSSTSDPPSNRYYDADDSET